MYISYMIFNKVKNRKKKKEWPYNNGIKKKVGCIYWRMDNDFLVKKNSPSLDYNNCFRVISTLQ